MADTLDLFFRAHTIPVTPQKEYRSRRRATQPKEALIFRCATSNDEKKELLFGAYICADREGTEYVAKEIGLFYREGHPEEFRALAGFVKGSAYELGSLEEFRRGVFLKYLKARALSLPTMHHMRLAALQSNGTNPRKRGGRSPSISECSGTRRRARCAPAVTNPGFRLKA